MLISPVIKRRRGMRAVRISVSRGKVVVSVPLRAGMRDIDEALRIHSDWIRDALFKFEKTPAPIRLGSEIMTPSEKESSRAFISERLSHWNSVYGFRIGRVSIRDSKTRWGSCSKKGNLNFNFRVAHLPAPLADYVIVHEICHLKEFNHSEAFWRLMERTIVSPKKLRKNLKKYALE